VNWLRSYYCYSSLAEEKELLIYTTDLNDAIVAIFMFTLQLGGVLQVSGGFFTWDLKTPRANGP
jgi:hypothetical protein